MKYLKSFNESNSIMVTLPSSVKWDEYRKELNKAEKGESLNFKVSNFPKNIKEGDRCYIVHEGQIKGWMSISGLQEDDFECTTTGKKWKGKFIQRSGKFNYIDPIPMKGFQGYRYFKMEEAKTYKTFLTEGLEFRPVVDDFNRMELHAFLRDDKVGKIIFFTTPEMMNPDHLPISYIEIERKYRGGRFFKDLISYAAKMAKWEYGYDGITSTLTAHPEVGYRNTDKSWKKLIKNDRKASFDEETNTYFYNA